MGEISRDHGMPPVWFQLVVAGALLCAKHLVSASGPGVANASTVLAFGINAGYQAGLQRSRAPDLVAVLTKFTKGGAHPAPTNVGCSKQCDYCYRKQDLEKYYGKAWRFNLHRAPADQLCVNCSMVNPTAVSYQRYKQVDPKDQRACILMLHSLDLSPPICACHSSMNAATYGRNTDPRRQYLPGTRWKRSNLGTNVNERQGAWAVTKKIRINSAKYRVATRAGLETSSKKMIKAATAKICTRKGSEGSPMVKSTCKVLKHVQCEDSNSLGAYNCTDTKRVNLYSVKITCPSRRRRYHIFGETWFEKNPKNFDTLHSCKRSEDCVKDADFPTCDTKRKKCVTKGQ